VPLEGEKESQFGHQAHPWWLDWFVVAKVNFHVVFASPLADFSLPSFEDQERNGGEHRCAYSDDGC